MGVNVIMSSQAEQDAQRVRDTRYFGDRKVLGVIEDRVSHGYLVVFDDFHDPNNKMLFKASRLKGVPGGGYEVESSVISRENFAKSESLRIKDSAVLDRVMMDLAEAEYAAYQAKKERLLAMQPEKFERGSDVWNRAMGDDEADFGHRTVDGKNIVSAYFNDRYGLLGRGNMLVVTDEQIEGNPGNYRAYSMSMDGKDVGDTIVSEQELLRLEEFKVPNPEMLSLTVGAVDAAMERSKEMAKVSSMSLFHDASAPGVKGQPQKGNAILPYEVGMGKAGHEASKLRESVDSKSFGTSEAAWQQDLLVNGEPFVGAYSNDGTGNPLVVYGKGEQTPEGKRYNGVRLFGNGMGQLVSIGSRFLSSIAMYQVTDETKILELVRRAGPVVKKLLNGLAKPVPFGDVASKAMNKAASAAINAGASAINALSKSDLAKTLKNSPLGRASAAVAAGMATARSVMAEGRAAAPSRTSPLTGVSKNAMADIAREAKRVKFALYDVNGRKLAVMNRRSHDGKGYAAVWLSKDGKYSRTVIDDKNLVRLNESFRSLVCGMDDKAKMSEIKKSNFNLLKEYKAKGLAAALGLSNNVAFVPDYGFADGLAGKNFNPLSAQASLILNAAKKNELPMFRSDGQVLSSGKDFYMFPQGLFLDGQKVSRLGGMQAMVLSAQCGAKGIKGNNNAVVLTSDAAKMGADKLNVATMTNGPSVTSSSKANLYEVGELALEKPSRVVSAQLARRTEIFEESKGEFKRTGKINQCIAVNSEMPLMTFMACSLAAGRLGCALKIDPPLLDKYREEFTSTFGAKLGSHDFGSLYKKFGSDLSKETNRIVSQKTHEWRQVQNPAVQKNVEFKRERSMSQSMSMGIG